MRAQLYKLLENCKYKSEMITSLLFCVLGLCYFAKADQGHDLVQDVVESPRTLGCVGQFVTFGFLTFLITLLNTLLNIGKAKSEWQEF